MRGARMRADRAQAPGSLAAQTRRRPRFDSGDGASYIRLFSFSQPGPGRASRRRAAMAAAEMDPQITEASEKAKALIEALGYIQRFHDKVIVVKVGGSIMD